MLYMNVLLALGPAGSLAVAPAPHPVESRPSDYYGKVVAVDDRSITINGTEGNDKNGKKVTRRFGANDKVICGLQDPRDASRGDYHLSDVKAGDIVLIRIYQYGDDDLFGTVRIMRRPGGKVPPAPFDDPRGSRPYHVTANLLQAYEEKGTPLPRDLDPVLSRIPTQAELDIIENHKKRRARQLWIETHTAPMPRAVMRSR